MYGFQTLEMTVSSLKVLYDLKLMGSRARSYRPRSSGLRALQCVSATVTLLQLVSGNYRTNRINTYRIFRALELILL